MTQKSQGRRDRDAKQRAANGGKRIDREKHSRCWFELKLTHSRSQEYIVKTAKLFGQYGVPKVLVRIQANGDRPRWEELQSSVPKLMETFMPRFQELFASHGDRKKLCLSYTELQLAFRIFEAYQVFDLDFYNAMSPIVEELNDIFNKALKQELEEGNVLIDEVAPRASAEQPPVDAAEVAAEVDPSVGHGLINIDPKKEA